MRGRSSGWQTLIAIVATVAMAGGLVWVAGPQIVVGDPLSRHDVRRFRPKPLPPKTARIGDRLKPTAVDFGPAAPVGVAAPDDPGVRSLTTRLQAAVVAAGDAGQRGIQVMDADGNVVFDLDGSTPLIPASTAKLVTAAVVLAAFGPDHTFTTSARATSSVSGGVVAGDVLLVGGADPTLISQTFIDTQSNPERPQTPIAGLADQIVAAGVTRIDGAVVGDPGFLHGETLANGWPPRYLEELDATPITGLTIDQGLEFFDEEGTVQARAATDPALQAAIALSEELTARGVVIGGIPSTIEPGTRVDTAAELGTLQSPPVSVLLTRVVQDSDNHMADTLFRATGRYAAGNGGFDDAEMGLDDLLADLELDFSTTLMQDGSGLSRATAIPPALLTTLNYRMTTSSQGELWQQLMAVSGVSGTLERRLVGSIAELRLRGKTGSLEDARALSGAVVGPDGRPLYFTVTSNGVADLQVANARRLQDLVVLALSAELYGCTELPPAPPTEPLEPDQLPPLPTHTC